MATTSLWHIKGDIRKLISYVENEKKTVLSSGENLGLDNVIAYDTNMAKTAERKFVTGINCLPSIAAKEMIITKLQFGKTDGRIAYHGYQSFLPCEVSPDIAHEIGIKYAKAMWGDRFQVIVSTHLDKEHIHNHFCLNSVSFIDGGKYDRSKAEYIRMRKVSDGLCREYGLSVIEEPRKHTPRQIYCAEKRKESTLYNIIRADIDEAIGASITDKQFFAVMKNKGYVFNFDPNRKYHTLRAPGMQHNVRLKTLGTNYTKDAIYQRILENRFPNYKLHRPMPIRRRYCQVHHPLKNKIGGIYGLYLHYCFLLGILPKGKPSRKPHAVLRAERRKVEKSLAQLYLIRENKIASVDDLNAFVYSHTTALIELESQRTKIINKLRRAIDPDVIADLKNHRALLTDKMKPIRIDINTAKTIISRIDEIHSSIARAHEHNERMRLLETQTITKGQREHGR
ncbi:MAG: relaxase/mobilization nuclease domain-containing protein [Clostridiales Family XIII bacterium]|jgi:hypothetical protein|nr:relaxase/mobilization nuclease domain-containing protein [Clostridiales Family XIII bacterium]